MAERRMLSKKITSSARFLRMSHTSQALYMHLVMDADDDGVVEAFSIMRLAAASEENLQELAERKFIRILNEDLVAHILDWDENNKIRPDRKRDSIYKDLLEQTEAEEVEATTERTTEESRNDAPAADCGQVTADCGQLPADCGQVTADCPHRIGKDRLGKDNIYAAAANARMREESPKEKDHGAVFRAFSDNIHPITGEIERDRIVDLTDEYGALWVKSAIEEAALSNGRSLRYITAILERWRRDGFKAKRKEINKHGGADRNRDSSGENSAEKSVYAAYFDRCTGAQSEETGGSPGAGDGDSALLREENGEAAHRRRAPDGGGGVSGTA
ncbi:MAG: DnaD domain-containing protein [Schwartzia sp. (in: firmicutes)]